MKSLLFLLILFLSTFSAAADWGCFLGLGKAGSLGNQAPVYYRLLSEVAEAIQVADKTVADYRVSDVTKGAEGQRLHNLANAAYGLKAVAEKLQAHLQGKQILSVKEFSEMFSLLRETQNRMEEIRSRRKEAGDRERTSVASVLEKATRLLSISRNPDLELQVVAHPFNENLAIPLAEGLILEAIENIGVNAGRHAFKGRDKGILEVRGQVREQIPDALPPHTTRTGNGIVPNRRYFVLEVRDNGSGMDASTRENIFKEGITSDSSQGRGLGLASVAQVANEHHGFVECTSEPGKGTTFRIAIPFYSNEDYALPPRESAPSKRARIAVIDDDRIQRFLTMRLSEQACTEYPSAISAVEAFRKEGLPELAFVDLNMGTSEMGLEDPAQYIAALKAAGVKVVIVSATGETNPNIERDLIAQYGADAMVRKPINKNVFQSLIDRFLPPSN